MLQFEIMNDNYLIIIIVLLAILSFGVLIISIFLGLVLYKKYISNHNNQSLENKKNEEVLLKDRKSKEIISSNKETTLVDVVQGQCDLHPDVKAVSTCSICNKLLCEQCSREYETLHFCGEHFELFLNNKWVELETIQTTPDEATKSMYLYDFKEKKWQEQHCPSYIMTHYKINVDTDTIESHIKLYVRDTDYDVLKKDLKR